MRAEMVWHVWRRILREPAIQDCLFTTPAEAVAQRFGFEAESVPALAAYASQPQRTGWFVTNYRFRLTNSYLHALETGAPLTLRALFGAGFDWKALAKDFLDKDGWRDFGPNVYAYASAVMEDLLANPLTGKPAGLRDLIRLEHCGIELVRANAKPKVPPVASDGFYRQTGRGAFVTLEHTLTPWLKDKSQLGKGDLVHKPQVILVSMPTPSAAITIAGVPARAITLYEALANPMADKTLAEHLGSGESLSAEDMALLTRLQKAGALEQCGAIAPLMTMTG
jgi:hypothetical protein